MPGFNPALLTDYHTHTPLCRHAEGWPLEYARAASELGLAELGFADHSPMPRYFDDWRMLLEEFPRYVDAVEEARAAFPGLPIRLGLEVDYLEGQEGWIEELAGMAEWDFLIGSVHYVSPDWVIDNPAHLSRYADRPLAETWALYGRTLERAIRTRAFDFIGHADLPKKFGHRLPGDPREHRRWIDPIVQALLDTGTAFEINTAGLRKPIGECYPSLDFLRVAREAGVDLLINSDAHAPGEVGAGFAEGVALAREAGYSELVRFEKRRRTRVPF